jgi:hypothetical protein
MLRVLIDQDFDHDILRGLVRRLSGLDYTTALEVGLSEADDPELLLWAAENGRILFTHDRKTMPKHFAALFDRGETLAGVIVVPRRLPIAQAIDELEIIVSCSEPNEWQNIIKILPL